MKDSDFQQLLASVKEAGRIKRGEQAPARRFEVKAEDVKAIRAKLNKSQSEFALMIGVSISTLQNWEQGRRQPEGPAQALLRVASVNPRAVAAALDPSQASSPKLAADGSRRR
ncbi:MAG TPA: NadS family protein [Thermoanaerobaculia bacterium]|nr:NadS family protein [Thermoanaerobaculia bacterium]